MLTLRLMIGFCMVMIIVIAFYRTHSYIYIILIINMQQVLNLLFLNHRKSLAYPENHIGLSYRQTYQEALPKPRRNFMMDSPLKPQHKSVDLNIKNNKKQVEQHKPKKKGKLTGKLSKHQQILMQKYLQGFISSHKNQLYFPAIDQRNSQRGTTANQAYSFGTNQFSKASSLGLSPQKREKIRRKAKKKFRRCVNAILFTIKIRKIYEMNQYRLKQIMNLSQNIPLIIQKTINKYYSQILQAPLYQFGQILKRKILESQYKPTQDIVNNLLQLSTCLKNSSVRKDMLRFLTLITLEDTPLPHDFFFQFQMQRLDFKENKFKLQRISQQQIRMIVGMFLGVKLFCFSIFKQPWRIQFLNISNRLNKKALPILYIYSSYFFTVFTNMFKQVPIHNSRYIKQLIKKGVKPMQMKMQGQQFYDRLVIDYHQLNIKIVGNLSIWVQRITAEVVKNRVRVTNQYHNTQQQ